MNGLSRLYSLGMGGVDVAFFLGDWCFMKNIGADGLFEDSTLYIVKQSCFYPLESCSGENRWMNIPLSYFMKAIPKVWLLFALVRDRGG